MKLKTITATLFFYGSLFTSELTMEKKFEQTKRKISEIPDRYPKTKVVTTPKSIINSTWKDPNPNQIISQFDKQHEIVQFCYKNNDHFEKRILKPETTVKLTPNIAMPTVWRTKTSMTEFIDTSKSGKQLIHANPQGIFTIINLENESTQKCQPITKKLFRAIDNHIAVSAITCSKSQDDGIVIGLNNGSIIKAQYNGNDTHLTETKSFDTNIKSPITSLHCLPDNNIIYSQGKTINLLNNNKEKKKTLFATEYNPIQFTSLFKQMLALCDSESNIFIIPDINIDNPKYFIFFDSNVSIEHITSMQLHENHLYIGTNDGFLHILSVSTDDEPKHVTTIYDKESTGPISSITIDEKNKLLVVQQTITQRIEGIPVPVIKSNSIITYPLFDALDEQFKADQKIFIEINEKFEKTYSEKINNNTNSAFVLYELLKKNQFFLFTHPYYDHTIHLIKQEIKKNIKNLTLEGKSREDRVKNYLEQVTTGIGINFKDSQHKPQQNTFLTQFDNELFELIIDTAYNFAKQNINNSKFSGMYSITNTTEEFKNFCEKYPLLKTSILWTKDQPLIVKNTDPNVDDAHVKDRSNSYNNLSNLIFFIGVGLGIPTLLLLFYYLSH